MRILWSSNAPWAASGYGNQTRVFVPRLKDAGHEMAMHAWYGLQGGVLSWKGIPTYPSVFHPYGQDIMAPHALNFRADLIITLIDAWVLDPAPVDAAGLRLAPWFPVDMEPLIPGVLDKVSRSFQPIVFSNYGQRLCTNAGLHANYVPHGVETSVFRPVNRVEAREKLGLPTDCFLVGMVAANKGQPSRKAFPQALLGFKELRRRHPDARLYLHTHPADQGQYDGVALTPLLTALDLMDAVHWPDEYTYLMGAPDQQMCDLYNTFDVLLSPSMGEGFGIPIIEAQACGTPVVVGDWTSMSELCLSGWAIPKTESDPYWWPISGWQRVARPGAVAEALEYAYQAAGNQELRDRAWRLATAYDADLVTHDYWLPVLDGIAERIGLPARGEEAA